MQIAVVGAGAMGCLFGGMLAEAGHTVRLVTRLPEEAGQIQVHGVRLEGLSGERTLALPATADVREAADAELVLLAVKAYDTATAVAAVAAAIPPPTPVLTLQNGLENVETIAAAVGPERTLGGITAHGATGLGVGHVRHAGRGPTVIGEADGPATERTERLAAVFGEAGLETTVTDDLTATIWHKLIVNVGINALASLMQRRNGELLDGGPAEALLEQAVAEAVAVAAAQGIAVDLATEAGRVKEVCRATAMNLNSMLQDLRHGRRTEIDFINGAIVRVGDAVGVPTPVNRVLTQLVRAVTSQPGLLLERKQQREGG
jgi:2-dehydropantoate 2-reductase